MKIVRQDVLRLYRELINYSRGLKYTDKDYYLARVKQEFIQNKNLESADEIVHQFNVCITLFFYLKGNVLHNLSDHCTLQLNIC